MITLFDTSICSTNLGDFIIMHSAKEQLEYLMPDATHIHAVTHDKISKPTYHLVNKSKYSFVCGTNLLSSNMHKYNQWKINLYDSLFLKGLVLMGVGWWQYQNKPNLYTKYLLKTILNKEIFHSVRDSYTENMLRSIGIKNVYNTACPTMWKLTKEFCHDIPIEKADAVVMTITDYNLNILKDIELIKILKRNYSKVYFWPQGSEDISYLKKITLLKDLIILPPTLSAYTNFLKTQNISLDYVGTRLHAGIMAIQNKIRTIIIGIDNRAIEKQKDFNLNICKRNDIQQLESIINVKLRTDIKIPEKLILAWKNQFV